MTLADAWYSVRHSAYLDRGGPIPMRRTSIVLALAVCLALALSLLLGACDEQGGDVVGIWVDEPGLTQFQFKAHGTLIVQYPGQEFAVTYTATNGRLSIQAAEPEGAAPGSLFQGIEYAVNGNELTLTNSDGQTQILHKK